MHIRNQHVKIHDCTYFCCPISIIKENSFSGTLLTLNQPLHWMITYIYALSYACMTGTFYCTKDNCNTICYMSSPTILILFSENNPLVRLTWWCPCCVTCWPASWTIFQLLYCSTSSCIWDSDWRPWRLTQSVSTTRYNKLLFVRSQRLILIF